MGGSVVTSVEPLLALSPPAISVGFGDSVHWGHRQYCSHHPYERTLSNSNHYYIQTQRHIAALSEHSALPPVMAGATRESAIPLQPGGQYTAPRFVKQALPMEGSER